MVPAQSTRWMDVVQCRGEVGQRKLLDAVSGILLTAESQSARGGSGHPAFMDGSLTVSQTRLPCPPFGKMGLQSWTVMMAINKLSNLFLNQIWQHGGYFAELPPLKPWFYPAETPKSYCLTSMKMACANDGGDYEVLYRWRQVNIAGWERLIKLMVCISELFAVTVTFFG